MKNKIIFALGFLFSICSFTGIMLACLHVWSVQ